MPSATIEEYLETIYKLSESGAVRPTQVAEALGVSGPTVTATMGRLEKAGLIERPDGGIALTEQGRIEALTIIRSHRLAEVFLHDVLELPWEVVHDEACRWEHALSPQVADALEVFLKDPKRCPHGHIIPGPDGSITEMAGVPLSQAEPGVRYAVAQVDEDAGEDFLVYVGGIGLYPGTEVEVVEVAPFGGAVTVLVADTEHAVGRDAAARVRVTKAE